METLSLEEYRETMKGIYTTSVSEATLDEAPMAYKSLADILDVVQETVDGYGMAPFVDALNGVADMQLGYRPPLQSQGGPDNMEAVRRLEHDIVYSGRENDDGGRDGMARLRWKLRRWKAPAWKRRMVFSDSKPALLLASLTSHAEKPQSILHKM